MLLECFSPPLTSPSLLRLPWTAATEDYKGGNDGNIGSEGGDDAATVQYSFSGNEEQESSSPPTDPHDPDMPPPLPPPQVELPSSSPRRGFIVSL